MTSKFHEKPNMYVSHVQLKVSNLQQSIEFYEKVIGFKTLQRTNTTAHFTTNEVTSILSIVEVENALPLQRNFNGLYHFALLLPTRKDLGSFIQHLMINNIPFGAANHDVSEAIYLNDPDGNGIEVYRDRPEHDWTWVGDSVHMVTETLNIQQIIEQSEDKWRGLPENTVMGHLHLSVSDLLVAEQFYGNILNYDVVFRYGKIALFLATNNYHHHIALNTFHGTNGITPPENAVGIKYFEIAWNEQENIDEFIQRLQNQNIQVGSNLDASIYGKNKLFAIIDPFGNKIVFTK